MAKENQGLRYADSTERTCLAAALTLLVRTAIIDQQELIEAIDTKEFEGIMRLLNEAYKEKVPQDGFEG